MLVPMSYEIPMSYEQSETVEVLEADQHLEITCQTLAEASAGGAWYEMVIIPWACWNLVIIKFDRMA